MRIEENIYQRQLRELLGYIPIYDPYKANCRQCNGRCPKQKFDKIKRQGILESI